MTYASRNPFCGLRPFALEDAPFFFGRDEMIDEVVDRLDMLHAVAIFGPSGSGKSSLVRAGVLPTLLAERPQYRVVFFRPGLDPIANLVRALEDAGISAPDDTLRASSFGLVNCVTASDAARDGILLIADQFEEVFRATGHAHHSDEVDFLAALLASTITSDALIRVLLTVRSEFIGELAQLPALPDALSRALVLIPRMRRRQFTEIIERPLEQVHSAIERSCVQTILNDLNEIRDPLPQMQHVLSRMWEVRQLHGIDRPININDYDAAGRIAGALDRHAESLLQALSEADCHLAKRLLPLLAAEQDGRVFRRPATIRDLAAATDSPPDEVRRVTEPFVRDGLFFLHISGHDDAVLDIAHESLLREWRRLGDWVRAELEARDTYLRLVDRAAEYGRGRAGLLQDPELTLGLNWIESWRPNRAWAARYGDDQSLEAVLRYLDMSHQKHAEQSRLEISHRYRTERRLRGMLTAAIVSALLTFLFLLLVLRFGR